jgi:hypothetical protein
MGLTALAEIRTWLRNTVPDAVLLPQEVHRTPDDVLHIDLTQWWRKVPGELTGSAFALWVWQELNNYACVSQATLSDGGIRAIVCVMDKQAYVPPEKAAEQKERVSTSPWYSEMSVIDEEGVCSMDALNPGHDQLWHTFRACDMISSRNMRGRLCDWLVRWIGRHVPDISPLGVPLYLEFAWPEERPRVVEVAAYRDEVRVCEVDEWVNTCGEADLVHLIWLERHPTYRHIDLQIDSDIIPIALMHLQRKVAAGETLPVGWIWVACNHDWTRDAIVAERADFGDDFNDEIVPVAGADKNPVFCLDLVKMYHGLVAQGHNILCVCLAMLLCGDDYFKSKSLIARGESFAATLAAVKLNWEHWGALVMQWCNERTWRATKMYDHTAFTSHREHRSKKKSADPTQDDLDKAHTQLRFSLMYKWNPFPPQHASRSAISSPPQRPPVPEEEEEQMAQA